MTDVTLTTNLDAEQREYLEIVKFSADSLLGIVNDILDFSKIEARKLTLDRTPFELRKSLDELVRSLQLRARQKNLFFTCEVAKDIPNDLLGDPLRLRQVLLNLLDNAIKFTTVGGVSLSVTREGSSDSKTVLHFAVTDTGIGIPPDKQADHLRSVLTSRYFVHPAVRRNRPGPDDLLSDRRHDGGTPVGGKRAGDWQYFHFTGRLEVLPPTTLLRVEPELPVSVSA